MPEQTIQQIAAKENHFFCFREPTPELMAVLDRIPDGFFAVDREWRITHINHWLEIQFSIRREDYLFRDLWTVYPTLHSSVYEEQFRRAVQENVTVKMERFSKTHQCWFELTAHPSVSGLSVFLRDITESKQSQEALRQANERFRLAANTDAIYDWDIASDYMYWGEGLQEIFGYTTYELQMAQWYVAVHPDDVCWLGENLKRTLESADASLWKQEYRMRHKEGHYCYVYERGNIIRDSEGRAVRMVGIIHNITERKQAEEELRKLSLVAKETEDAVIMLDPESRITWVNAAFTRMTGYRFEEAIGKMPSVLLNGSDTCAETLAYINAQQQQKLPVQVEILNYKKSGEPFWSDMSMQPLFDRNGNVEQYFSIRKDITERKKLESELTEQQKKITAAVISAQERERAQVGRELHDNVNQVLTTVKLYQELIAAGVGETGVLVEKSIRLLQQSITEIRNLSRRLSAPTLGNIWLKDSVSELLSNVEATHRFVLIQDTADLDELEVAEALHLAVYRILQEQLTNILKYAGASVVTVRITVEGRKLVLTVTDNGSGFDTGQKRSGTGITNMRMRAESLGGEFAINSDQGKGCELRVTLPLEV
ncbi:MAG TPA: PAS domain S-box protein [Flavisolibacter sp.]|jgi:PAS domain S-box-containing protein|nr:PAS domain S-box protein [Flavisolibacter sp.]